MKTLLSLTLLFASLSSFASGKMVIGKDERIQITAKNKTEVHEAIGLIFYEYRGMTFACTGTIIAPKVVLTAAHCINFFADTYFVPGQIKRVFKLSPNMKNAVKAKFVVQFDGYNKLDSLTTDLGVLVFDKEFKARPLSLSTQYGQEELVSIAGYPDDKKNGTLWEGKGLLSENSYTIDTYGGQSGSAIRNQNNEIIGVHSHANNVSIRNYACMLKPQHIEFIERFTK